jgi:hypothetical protein
LTNATDFIPEGVVQSPWCSCLFIGGTMTAMRKVSYFRPI